MRDITMSFKWLITPKVQCTQINNQSFVQSTKTLQHTKDTIVEDLKEKKKTTIFLALISLRLFISLLIIFLLANNM
uniref:Uncharacterized protein n=1 Tax=Rhizophora mucronata TaxID=61149 RepID=A0A2P2QMJ2_RHIMU